MVNPTTDLESPSKVVWGNGGNAVAKSKTGLFSVFLVKRKNDAHRCVFVNFIVSRIFTAL